MHQPHGHLLPLGHVDAHDHETTSAQKSERSLQKPHKGEEKPCRNPSKSTSERLKNDVSECVSGYRASDLPVQRAQGDIIIKGVLATHGQHHLGHLAPAHFLYDTLLAELFKPIEALSYLRLLSVFKLGFEAHNSIQSFV